MKNMSRSKLHSRVLLYNSLLNIADQNKIKVTTFDQDFYIVNKIDRRSEGYMIQHHGMLNNMSRELTPSQNFFNSEKEARNKLYEILTKWTYGLAEMLNSKTKEIDVDGTKYNISLVTNSEFESIKKELNE